MQGGGPGRAEMRHYRGHVGADEQPAGVHSDGQQGRGEVLVDDGFDAAQLARAVVDDGDAAASPADEDGLGAQQSFDRVLLDDPLRAG